MDESYRLSDPSDIISPALICYPEKIRRNIARMTEMAGGSARLWPHVKTYKCAEVVRMLMEAGIRFFKCATIAEAEMCAVCGAERVALAYPLVGPNIRRFVSLCAAFPGTDFFAIGDDEGQLALLAEAAEAAGITVQYLIDIDTGLHRTGVVPERAPALAEALKERMGLRLRGFHVYDGQHHEASAEIRRRAVTAESGKVAAAREILRERGFDMDIVLAGGTPTFPYHLQSDCFLSPGTCVIQDAGYGSTYADLPFEPAAAVLTRVVSHPGEGLFTLDLGCKAVASDPPLPRAVVLGYEDCETVMHNEEHLVLRLPKGEEDRRPAIGEALYALPWHICPTTLLYPEILAVEAGRVVGHWPVTARDRKLTI
ncbi:MAG: D-TA family PLP-dependent enzyme [Clostridia bacterium]|nr:D-TA family PLP-dependent enzyme [Clostridia bacterium]